MWSVIDIYVIMQGSAASAVAATTTKKKGQEDEDVGAPLKASSGKEQRFRDEKNLKVQLSLLSSSSLYANL